MKWSLEEKREARMLQVFQLTLIATFFLTGTLASANVIDIVTSFLTLAWNKLMFSFQAFTILVGEARSL